MYADINQMTELSLPFTVQTEEPERTTNVSVHAGSRLLFSQWLRVALGAAPIVTFRIPGFGLRNSNRNSPQAVAVVGRLHCVC